MHSIIIFIIAALLVSIKANAVEPALTSDDALQLNLNPYVELLEDPDGKLTIDQVSSPAYASRFKKNHQEVPTFGYTASAYWVRLTIRNQSLLNEAWVLETRPANINVIELYMPKINNKGFWSIKTGVSTPKSTRDVFHHRFVFNLSLPYHLDQTFYLKIQNQSTLVVDLHLWHQVEFLKQSKTEYFLLGLFYGTMMIMLLYNLFLYISLREVSYFYYVVFFIAFLSWNILYEGIAQLYFFPDDLVVNQKVGLVLLSISGILLLGFAKSFLRLKAYSPQLSSVITSLQYITCFILIFIPFVSYGAVAKTLVFIALITFVTITISFILLRKVQKQPVRFYFAAWGFLIFGFTLFLLVRLGILPAIGFNEFAYRFGVVWMITLLSLALADSINALKDNAEKANSELRTSEQLFKAIFNQTYQLIGLLSPDGRVIKTNNTALRFADIEPTDIVGKYFWDCPWWNNKEYFEDVKEAIHRAAKGEFIRFETTHVDHKNKKHIIDFSLKPISDDDGKVVLLIPEGRDITERKEMEDVLRESEEKYRELVDLAQDGILVLQDGMIQFANPYLGTMTGYEVSELVGTEFKQYIDASSYQEIMDRFFVDEEEVSRPSNYETKLIHKDGSECYVEYNANSITYKGKQAFLVLIRNIHNRKQAEAALKKSEASLESSERRYRELYDRSVVGMFSSRATDGKILSSNREANHIFGLSSNSKQIDLIHTVDMYVNKDDQQELLKKLFQEGTLHNSQVKFRKISGEEFWAEISVKYYPESNLIEGSIKDVTRNKEAEEVLKRSREELNKLVKERTKQLEDSQNELLEKTRQLELSNQKLQENEYQIRSILENSPDYILNVDDSYKIQYCNRSVVGYEKQELVGTSILELTSGENQETLKTSIKNVLSKGAAENIEMDMRFSGADNHWFEIRFAPLRENDPISQVMIIATDITQRLIAESELEDAQNLAIEKAHKAGMADIASGILHNVGNLLNSVNTSIHVLGKILRNSSHDGLSQANSILREKLDSLDDFVASDPKGKLLLKYYFQVGEMIEKEHDQLADNTNRIKEKLELISGVIAAQQSFADADSLTEKHSLASVVEDVLTIHMGSIERYGIAIEKDFCELPKIPIQKAKLVHVLISVLDNATEAMADLNDQHKKITISTAKEAENVILTISDTGIGIAEENLKRIFMHDYRNAQNRHCFSLHCSAIYMTEMNGNIWAKSDGKNKGAMFFLQLPMH